MAAVVLANLAFCLYFLQCQYNCFAVFLLLINIVMILAVGIVIYTNLI